jgi:hypothetical protein
MPSRSILEFSWQDVAYVAERLGCTAVFCPECGDLCIGAPGTDALIQGFAQKANRAHVQLPCLDKIYGLNAEWGNR